MGTFDRSAFKATKTTNLQEQQDAAETLLGKKGRANFLKLKHGKNRVRILPAHPGSKSFCYPRTTHYLEVMARYKKDGKDIEELKRKPIFNAKVHAGLLNDPIDAYIDKAWKLSFDKHPEDDKARLKFMSPITNFREGIKSNTKWVVYAMLISGENRELGRLELPVSVKERLNEISIDSDEEDGVISTDPFTDPDEGRYITITYNKDAEKPADYYKTSINLKGPTPLTDPELDWLGEQPALEGMLVDSYSQKDFDMAIEGLKKFDEENEYDIFAQDDFLDTLEKIADQVPETKSDDDDEEPKKEKKKSAPKKAAPKAEEADDDDDDDELPWDVPLEEMDMDQLKGVIRREELDIRVLSKYTEEDLVEMIEEERELKESEKKSEKKTQAKPTSKKDPIDDEEEEEEESPRRRKKSRLADLTDEVED